MLDASAQIPDVAVHQGHDAGLADTHAAAERHPQSGLLAGLHQRRRRVHRDGFAAALKAQGIPTAIYYTKSMHQQTAYRDYPVAEGGLPVSESLSEDVISLPMHAYLDEATQDRVIQAVRGALSS